MRLDIAAKVRELRLERRWTQAELARRLGMSQARLSEVERGAGSFTAEQFLLILRIFNVRLTHFAGGGAGDRESQLQNALARFGALHLQESDEVLPSEQLEQVNDLVRETLVVGSPRLITALGPVLVSNIKHVNLGKLLGELAGAGLERRFGWLAENVLTAVQRELQSSVPRAWAQRYRRAAVVLESFLDTARSRHRASTEARPSPPDLLDAEIRSKQTLHLVEAQSSPVSRSWGVVTRLQPDDFSAALRAARDDH